MVTVEDITNQLQKLKEVFFYVSPKLNFDGFSPQITMFYHPVEPQHCSCLIEVICVWYSGSLYRQ